MGHHPDHEIEAEEDRLLLARYCQEGSESAFDRLAGKYHGLVRAVCIRQLGKGHPYLEDACQAVFIVLAKKAGGLQSPRALLSWLHRTALYVTSNVLRDERRRRSRVLRAGPEASSVAKDSDMFSERIVAELDAAIAGLSQGQREVVLQHYLAGKPYVTMANELGISEGALKKRAFDALTNLRAFFSRRGLTISEAMLSSVLLSLFIAPSASAAPIAAATAKAAILSKGVIKTMTIKALIKIGIAASLVLGGTASVIMAGAENAKPPKDGAKVAKEKAQAVPAWYQGQKVNEWREIPNTAMNSLAAANQAFALDGSAANTGPRSRMDAWCGLSIDTRSSQIWSVANGGHGDYFGNEVCTFDLMADAPKWVEWFAGSTGKVVDNVTPGGDPSHARYKDGMPCSMHSYYGQQFLEKQNRALRLGGSMAPIGSAFENVEGFDVSLGKGKNGWDKAGTFGFAVGGANGGWSYQIGWCACKDPVTENIYTIIQPKIYKFTPSATGVGGQWSVFGNLPNSLNSGALGATAVDTKRNRLLWVKGYGPNAPMVCDLKTAEWKQETTPVSEGKAEFESLTASIGLVYAPEVDKFFARANAAGPKVYVIDPQTFAVTFLSTTGNGGIPKGVALNNEEGVYNRWLYVPRLHGIVYFPNAGANAWFLRIN